MNGVRSPYVGRALHLAARALGRSSPNPAVGAVLVRDGAVVGEGWTQPPGQAHAEIVALRQAGDAARGATLYVTLEPCSHYGRTPPCALALIDAGVAEVHASTLDPNPRVAGAGFRLLREAGVRVFVGDGARRAFDLNAGFFKHVATGVPHVTAKWAMTLDGKIATRTGDSRWISGAGSRRLVHRWRARSDAVMVGVGTALADDPELTVRGVDDEFDGPAPQPRRVVLDTRARLPLAAKLLSPQLARGTTVCVGETAPAERVEAIRTAGATVWTLPCRAGRLDLGAVLERFGADGVTSVLLEGGSELLAAAVDGGHVDHAAVFVGPKVFGGSTAPGPVGGIGVTRVAEAPPFRLERVEAVDGDALLLSRPAPLPWRDRLIEMLGIAESDEERAFRGVPEGVEAGV